MKQGSWRGTFSAVLFATLLAGLASSVTAIADTTDTTTSSPTDNGDSLATDQTTESLIGGGGTDSGAIAYGEAVLGPQKHETGITALGPDLFGEEINTNTGGISFSQTDLSLPGNNALPVNVTRHLIVDGNKSPGFSTDVNLWRGYSFGEWELDLPYMSGIYSEQNGWEVSGSTPTARCSSGAYRPRDVEAASNVWFYSYQFWDGLQLNVPGQGEQNLLQRPVGAPFPVPSSALATAGGWTALTTKDQWHFSCLSSLQSGQPGEGFMALAPDGTRYWFDWMVSYTGRTTQGYGMVVYASGKTLRTSGELNRREYRLYPTRIEDRFGNYITYT